MVVFIAGLVAGVAVLTLPDRQGPYEKAIGTIRTALQDAQDRSVLTGEIIGLKPAEGRIEILGWTGTEWQPASAAFVRLPENVRIEINRENDDNRDTEQKSTQPALVFNPLGMGEPVSVDVVFGALVHSLEITAEGDVIDAARG